MPSSHANDAIAPPLQTLMDLFSSDLDSVRFPDLDAAALEKAADRVRVHAETLANAEAAVATAQAMLTESQDALLAKGQRAIAYLRVYAEDNAELTEKLDAINLPRASRRLVRGGSLADSSTSLTPVPEAKPKPKKRRGASSESDPLFPTPAADA